MCPGRKNSIKILSLLSPKCYTKINQCMLTQWLASLPRFSATTMFSNAIIQWEMVWYHTEARTALLQNNVLNICVFSTEKNVSLFRVLRLFAKDNYFRRNILKSRYALSYWKIAILGKTITDCCWLGGMKMELQIFHLEWLLCSA